ncbi:MAG TPA: hypothetical protein VN812_23925, partial [Candidatus Acidoferrales bacterium]|nr:hypothetical protein [Candidatus Acidoferrales bacterium]
MKPLVVEIACLAALVSAAQAQVITEYGPTADAVPTHITQGPDGNLWFTNSNGGTNKIGMITTAGVITEYGLTQGPPDAITAGPDGNLWFADHFYRIGRITTAGVITEYGFTAGQPTGITQGPDGNLWFTDNSALKIGKITTAGVITEYGPTAGPGQTPGGPQEITAGPDGNLWFTYNSGGTNQIGKITTAGVITEYGPTAGITLGITTGPDGNLWFADNGASMIGKITTAGVITEYGPTAGTPVGITTGPDGNLWFADYGASMIGKVTLPTNTPTPPTPTPTLTPDLCANVTCTALDQCHAAGTCDPATGQCSNPPAPSGSACDDGNACTQTDQCDGNGTCVGSNPVVCTALDQCHIAGTCDPSTGTCSNPTAADGAVCDAGNACAPRQSDACLSGGCIAAVCVSESAGPGEMVMTGTTTTATQPVQSAVTVPNGGMVSITQGVPSTTPPTGFSVVGEQVMITAPTATAGNPLILTFVIDASQIPSTGVGSIQVYKNGNPVQACTNNAQLVAAPDPCVSSQKTLANGDGEITVLTSEASLWTFAVPTEPLVAIPLASVSLRANTRTQNGTIGVQAVFDASPLGNLGTALSDGFTVAVAGAGLAAAETMRFAYPNCFNLGRVIQCIGTRGEEADFQKQQTTGHTKLKITAEHRSFAPPLTTAGVTVTLGLAGYDLRGEIASCTVGRRA